MAMDDSRGEEQNDLRNLILDFEIMLTGVGSWLVGLYR